jgi:hypothetical protein
MLAETDFETETSLGSVAIADINGDGQQELLGGIRSRDIHCPGCADFVEQYRLQSAVVVAEPDGTMVPGFPKPIPVYWPEEPEGGGSVRAWLMVEDPRFVSPAVADLDGDGLKEVIWPDPDTNLLFVWNVPGTPGPEFADWPMFRHDPQHTNVLPPTR